MTFLKTVLAGLLGLGAILGFGHPRATPPVSTTSAPIVEEHGAEVITPTTTQSRADVTLPPQAENKKTTATTTVKEALTDAQLLALADDKYVNNDVPLGDDRYVTDAAKKGYVYLCNVRKDNPGSMVNGPWIHGTSWSWKEKVSVDGSVSWPAASFNNILGNSTRTLITKALPIDHTTGVYPVASTDDASKYDPNPNTISAQNITKILPANPTYSETPYCMGGEVGIMLSGVPLFNAFDAGLRDAPAHELQDSCSGHPQGSGEYHYHSESACFKDKSVKKVLGYAYDGFPITGAKVAENKYLTTEDLDICHGIISEVEMDGAKKVTYHYVMTKDFPYSASCFRGKPISSPMSMTPPSGGQQQTQTPSGMQQGMMPPPPGGNPPPPRY
jgi:hypothetical protein